METRPLSTKPQAAEHENEVNLLKLLDSQTRHFSRSAYESYFYKDRNLVGVVEKDKYKPKPEKRLDA